MNPDIKDLLNSIHQPIEIIDDENEYKFRRKIAEHYLSYEETIYTGERSKQDSLKKIHDYAKIWGARNAINTLVEWVLPNPAADDGPLSIADPDEDPDMISGDNRNRVLELFNERFDYDEFDEDIPKMKLMFNVLVDEMLAKELTEHDLEMVAMDIWNTIHGDIG